MYKDNPRAHSMEMIKSNLYKGSAGMFIAGTEQTVKSFNRETLLDKHRKIYVPENSVLCVVGNNSFEDVVKFAEKYLSIERKGVSLEDLNLETTLRSGEEKRTEVMQSNVCLGVHFPLLNSKERYSAEIFSSILGEGMSSRLFSEVREKRGLVYGVKSMLDLGRNYGYMVIWAGCDPINKEKVIEICKAEFNKMAELTSEELSSAKEQVVAKETLSHEASNDVAVSLTMNEFSTKAEDFYEYESNINGVSLESVRDLAKNSEFAVFSVGP
jgi:predicted Zn-dependent peptidase